MKIKKKSILKVFRLFSDTYTEFNKRIDTEEKLKSMVDNWVEIFEVLNFDYEEANDDFLQASKVAIIKSKYIPTISEISDEMKNNVPFLSYKIIYNYSAREKEGVYHHVKSRVI